MRYNSLQCLQRWTDQWCAMEPLWIASLLVFHAWSKLCSSCTAVPFLSWPPVRAKQHCMCILHVDTVKSTYQLCVFFFLPWPIDREEQCFMCILHVDTGESTFRLCVCLLFVATNFHNFAAVLVLLLLQCSHFFTTFAFFCCCCGIYLDAVFFLLLL